MDLWHDGKASPCNIESFGNKFLVSHIKVYDYRSFLYVFKKCCTIALKLQQLFDEKCPQALKESILIIWKFKLLFLV